MKSSVSFTLPKANHNTIKDLSAHSVSSYLETAFKDFLDGKLEISDEDLVTIKTSCSTSLSIASGLQDRADSLGIPVSRLVKVIVDKRISQQVHELLAPDNNQHLDYQEGITADRRTPKNQIHQERATYNVTRT